jgi:enolase-phosphatase E1
LIRTILTDIEGTTSSISFVRDVLFPYAARELPRFIRENASDPAVRALIRESAAEAGVNQDDLEAVIERLLSWIEEDRKITPLKALQGMIWESGYASGDYRAHVYEDAWRNLKRWSEEGYKLYVYSSGSIQAQQLFFRYSERGNLLPLFRGYFDTGIGGKKEPGSYRAIVDALATNPAEILFLSDVREELDAAKEAGLHTCWLLRQGESPAGVEEIKAAGHRTARSFDEVVIPI